MAYVVAVGSGKGGVGKSKLNLAVACTLAMRPERPRVLLVDLCQDQGMLSYMFAPEADRMGRGAGELIRYALDNKDEGWMLARFNETRVSVNVHVADGVQFDFLPAASEVLGELTINNEWVEGQRGELLSAVLAPLDDLYDYIVIDTIPLLRIHTTASVMAIANAFAVALDVQNMENIAGIDRFIAYAKGHGANLAGIIQNLYDSKFQGSKLAKNFVDHICGESHVPVIVTVPRSASVSNTSQVFDDETGLSSGVYSLLERDKSQRRNLEVVIERFQKITNALMEACHASSAENAANA